MCKLSFSKNRRMCVTDTHTYVKGHLKNLTIRSITTLISLCAS